MNGFVQTSSEATDMAERSLMRRKSWNSSEATGSWYMYLSPMIVIIGTPWAWARLQFMRSTAYSNWCNLYSDIYFNNSMCVMCCIWSPLYMGWLQVFGLYMKRFMYTFSIILVVFSITELHIMCALLVDYAIDLSRWFCNPA